MYHVSIWKYISIYVTRHHHHHKSIYVNGYEYTHDIHASHGRMYFHTWKTAIRVHFVSRYVREGIMHAYIHTYIYIYIDVASHKTFVYMNQSSWINIYIYNHENIWKRIDWPRQESAQALRCLCFVLTMHGTSPTHLRCIASRRIWSYVLRFVLVCISVYTCTCYLYFLL